MDVLGPNPEDIRIARNAAKLHGVLPEIQEAVGQQMAAIESRVYSAIRQGKLTPDMALSGWHEMFAAFSLLNGLRARVNIGQEAGARIAPKM